MHLQDLRLEDYSAAVAATQANSSQHLLKSFDVDRQRCWIFNFAPFIVPDRLAAAGGATVQMPTAHTHTHAQTHPLWGPADSFLPKLGADTSSRSDSNTGGTGQSLGEKQQKEKHYIQHRTKWWKLFLFCFFKEKKKLQSVSAFQYGWNEGF